MVITSKTKKHVQQYQHIVEHARLTLGIFVAFYEIGAISRSIFCFLCVGNQRSFYLILMTSRFHAQNSVFSLRVLAKYVIMVLTKMKDNFVFRFFIQQYVDIVGGLFDKAQAFKLLPADVIGSGEIDARGLDGGVAKHICQTRDVAAFLIENDGEQMTQVVRKDFAGRHMAGDGKAFHIGPHLITAHGFSIRGEKNLAADDFFLTGVLPQLVAEPGRDEDGADLSFEMHIGASTTHGFNGDGGKLGHTDASGTEGFDNEHELPPAAGAGGAQQLVVIGAAEGAVVGTKQFALHAQIAHATVRPAAKVKIAVQRCQHAVDGGGGIAGGKQMRFPTHNAGFFPRARHRAIWRRREDGAGSWQWCRGCALLFQGGGYRADGRLE